MWSVAAPVVVRMHGYIRGVPSVRIYPYPAVGGAQIHFYFFNRHKAYWNLFQNYLYGGIGVDIKVVQRLHAKRNTNVTRVYHLFGTNKRS